MGFKSSLLRVSLLRESELREQQLLMTDGRGFRGPGKALDAINLFLATGIL